MLRESLHTLFDDAHRGEDRIAATGEESSGKPPILRRRTIQCIAAVGIAAIVYGSLAPFRVDPARQFSWHLNCYSPIADDAVANVLIYIPIGLLARLLFRRRGSSWFAECTFSLALAGGLSYLTEVTQTILAHRVASLTDVMFNVSGAAIGMTFAPLVQRGIRNHHAWFYSQLRAKPFSAAAIATTSLIVIAALTPFDLHPTPGHLIHAIRHLGQIGLTPTWMTGDMDAMQWLDKLFAAGAYGVLACLLVLAAREAKYSLRAAIRYALQRSVAAAAIIESLQLLTVSHVAEPFDLVLACLCCVLGSAAAAIWSSNEPELQPRVVLRKLVMVVAAVCLGRAVVSIPLSSQHDPSAMFAWLPMAGGFRRSWNSLLSDYTASTLLYTIIGGLLVLHCRANHRTPRAVTVASATFAPVLLGVLLAILMQRSFDTVQLILASVAAAITIGLDRALFGKLRTAPQI